MGQKKLDWLPLFGDHKMNLETIEIPFLAGHIASKLLVSIEPGFSDLQSQQVEVRISGWYPMKVLQYKELIEMLCLGYVALSLSSFLKIDTLCMEGIYSQ